MFNSHSSLEVMPIQCHTLLLKHQRSIGSCLLEASIWRISALNMCPCLSTLSLLSKVSLESQYSSWGFCHLPNGISSDHLRGCFLSQYSKGSRVLSSSIIFFCIVLEHDRSEVHHYYSFIIYLKIFKYQKEVQTPKAKFRKSENSYNPIIIGVLFFQHYLELSSQMSRCGLPRRGQRQSES